MKRSLLIVVALLSVCNFARAAGSLPAYDGFSYSVGLDLGSTGTNAASGFKWTYCRTNPADPGPIFVTNVNLSYPGLAMSVGNAIATPGPGSWGLRYHSQGANVLPANNSLYYSVLFKITDLGALGAGVNSNYLFCLNNTSTTNQANPPTTVPGRLYVRASATPGKFNVGIAAGSFTSQSSQVLPTWSPIDFSPGDTVFVVLKWLYQSGTSSQAFGLVNPSPNDLASATVDLADPANRPSNTLINSVGNNATATVQSFLVAPQTNIVCTFIADEVRLGTNFAAVTPGGPPGFTNAFPATQSVNYGSTLVLNPGAAGPGSLTFQWNKDGSPLSDGNGYSGSATGTLSITNATAALAGSYALTVSSSSYGGPSISTTSIVSIVDPVITTQPQPVTLPPGSDAAFTVTAAGSGTLTYQWKKDTVDLSNGPTGSGSTISGATAATLTAHNIGSSDIGTYSVQVNGTGPSVLSSNALLTVNDPAITSQPADVTVNYNVNAAFQVTVAGTGPFTYQWMSTGVPLMDGTKFPGYHTANLTVTGPTYLDAGSYQVVVTNNLGSSVTSAVAVLTVNDPFFVAQPSSQIQPAGASTTFAVTASGSGTLGYQWYKAAGAVTNTLFDGGNVTGSTTDTLSLNPLSTNDNGSYLVVVSGGQTIFSTPVSLTVIDPPVITSPLQPRSVLAGTRVVFVAGVAGTAPFTFMWTKDGGSPLAVPSANYLNLTNVGLTDTGLYQLVVSNFAGLATNTATLSVSNPPLRLVSTNLVVLRVGDGIQTLSLNGNSVYLDQFTPAGTYLDTVSIPESGSTAFVMVGGGSTFTDCQITRSLDGTLLCLAGYATNLNAGFSVQGASGAQVPRAIYTVNAFGSAVLAKSSTTAYSGNIFRSAATDGTNNFWGSAGNGGTRYFGNGPNPAANIQLGVTNTRVVNCFNGQLYFTEAQNLDQSLWVFPSGLPLAADLPTRLLNVGGGGTPSPMAFSVSPDGMIIYIADDRASFDGGILRYNYDTGSGTYLYVYTIGTGVANVGARGLAVDWSGPDPVIYATTAESANNRIISITDTGVLSATTTLATSGDRQLYRSLAFGPVAAIAPISLAIAQAANQVALQWEDPTSTFILQFKTNVSDLAWYPVGVVPTGNYPTNTVTLPLSSATRFFRLSSP